MLINKTAAAQIADAKAAEADKAKRLQSDQLRNSTDFSDGARRAFEDYARTAGDAAANVEGVLTDAFRGAEDALVEFAMTGKMNFDAFARSIIADITHMAIRMAILVPLMRAFGGMFAPAGTGASGGDLAFGARGMVLDHGNVVPFARGGVVEIPTIFPMARGDGLMGEAGPEAVLPLRRTPSGNLRVEAGGVRPVVNFTVNNTGWQTSTGRAAGPAGHL